jgi:hypothetical protein
MILDKEINPELYKVAKKLATRKIYDGKRTIAKKNKTSKVKLKHTIDKDFILQLLRQSGCKCLYCGQSFVFESRHPMNFSIDRIDSSKGYTPENVQVIASWVNKAKSDLDEKQFFEYIKNVYNQIIL